MEQIAVNFTDGGVPKTGLTPTVTIIDRAGNTYVENGALKELGYGWYIYNFNRYSPDKVYLYMFDGGSALSNDYDRYRFGGNEFDAYSNKYSWGRTAAPYFTNVSDRFTKVDKAIEKAVKSRKEYNDSAIRKDINSIKDIVSGKGGYDLADKLIELRRMIETVSNSIKSESSIKGVSELNGKLDLMAEYVVKMKEDVDSELNNVGEVVTQSIQESNANLNEGMASRVTIDQLLQQVERLENRMNTVLDAFVKTQMEGLLPKDIQDQYDVNISRKGGMSDEEMMSALGIPSNGGNQYGLNQGMSEGMNMGMNEGVSEGLGAARPEQMDAPVDMQGVAEPIMPNAM